ncbi:MAG: 1-deoxy-D-xylulose-5-phosphate synthase, partial [Chlamydiota bacterium]
MLELLLKKKLQALSWNELDSLAQEIREEIIHVLSINGGHLASNLGIIELTIALHKAFESPKDSFIFDTGHQTYTHKILTERNLPFSTLRQYKGLAGFSHPEESPHDPFFSGHAGNAFSLALGLAKSRDLLKTSEHIIPILGDASFTCGLTLEALNHTSKKLSNFILVLNDNKMAISQNVGNIKNILSRLLSNPTSSKVYQDIHSFLSRIPSCGPFLARQGKKVTESIKNFVSPAVFFEEFGLSYIGPIPGHDIKKLTETFLSLRNLPYPVIVHVITTKGKGMPIATKYPTPYHGVKPFDIESGKIHLSSKTTFPQIFGKALVELGKIHPHLIALSPAMIEGSHLTNFFQQFPERAFDMGIAEGHCVTFAGGLSYHKECRPVVCIYASFLQRAFDNLFHDVCLQRFPVVFAIDRAGLNGPDGVTHHGIYDLGFLSSMPNLIIAEPRNGQILHELLVSSLSWNAP